VRVELSTFVDDVCIDRQRGEGGGVSFAVCDEVRGAREGVSSGKKEGVESG